MHKQEQRGFIALMSVIVISAILIVLVFTLGLSSFFNRFDTLDAENKRTSLGLAEACVNAAMLRIAQTNYSGGMVVVDSSDPQKTCKICQVTAGGVIQTRAVYNGTYTNLVVAVNPTPGNFSIVKWSETSTNGIPACTLP